MIDMPHDSHRRPRLQRCRIINLIIIDDIHISFETWFVASSITTSSAVSASTACVTVAMMPSHSLDDISSTFSHPV